MGKERRTYFALWGRNLGENGQERPDDIQERPDDIQERPDDIQERPDDIQEPDREVVWLNAVVGRADDRHIPELPEEPAQLLRYESQDRLVFVTSGLRVGQLWRGCRSVHAG